MDQKKKELKKLEGEISDPDFWSERDRAKSISQKYQSLEQEISDWGKMRQETGELLELAQIFINSGEIAGHEREIKDKLSSLEEQFSQREFFVLFSGIYDNNNAIMSVHAGTGGGVSKPDRRGERLCGVRGASGR